MSLLQTSLLAHDPDFIKKNRDMIKINKRAREIEEKKKTLKKSILADMDNYGVEKVEGTNWRSQIVTPKAKDVLDRELLIQAGIPIKLIDKCYKHQPIAPYLNVRKK